jgi:uncharacterized protein (TIGR02444 family)
MTSPPVEMESPLWRFSLAVYRGAGVQEECLGVQERFGVDVNLLMLCAYAGAVEGAVLSASDIADALEASGAWHGNVVKTLRQVRRTLKPWGAGAHDPEKARPALDAGWVPVFGKDHAPSKSPLSNVVEALRTKVKGAELEAEQIEQAMMWTWLRAQTGQLRRREPRQALAANVFALLVRCGATGAQADPSQALPQFCAAALRVGTRDKVTGTNV